MNEREALSILQGQGYRWVWSGTKRTDLAAFLAELAGNGWPEVSVDYGHRSCQVWGLTPDKTSTPLYRVCKDRRQF